MVVKLAVHLELQPLLQDYLEYPGQVGGENKHI